MTLKNTSDSIEAYIHQLLVQSGMAELKRSHLADYFQVVPSQINYVIKTRFTESKGYIVESKRGGGGYIRISKVAFSDKHQMLRQLMASIGECISGPVFADLVQLLFEERVMTAREGEMLMHLATDDILGDDAPAIRARLLRQLLQDLDLKRF